MSSSSFPLLGKYQIVEEIGRGGMGAVYKAHDPSLDRTVAIKVLAPHLVWEKDFVERFLREARAAGRLQHPNIIPIHDVGQEGNNYYFVMAYLPGPSLKQRIAQKGKLTPDEALPILRQLADALDYAHSEGLIHRDVKPANVMFDRRGQAVLTDFGIVKAVEESRLTGTGATLGTPHYMAPEQVRGAPVGARSDQYALAIMAFEMLTGQVPFDADTTTAVLFKQINDPPPSIWKICPDLPRATESVMNRTLSKSPDKRYASCNEFVKALEQALAQAVTVPRKPVEKPEPPTTILAKVRKPSQGLLLIGAGIAALVIMALAIVVFSGKPGPATPTPVAAVQPTSTATPAATSTFQPTPTRTPMPPTQTPTPSATLRASTPVPQPAMDIAPDNVGRVTQLAEWSDVGFYMFFSPDSKRLATGGTAVSIWEVSSGRQVWGFTGFTTQLSPGLAFSPDGALLAASAQYMKVWDVSSGRELYTLPGIAFGAAFSPDGKILASGGTDHTLRLWDVSSGRQLQSMPGHPWGLNGLVFSPDGKLLASANGDTVVLREIPGGRELRTFSRSGQYGNVENIAFSPDGKSLALAERVVRLIDVSSGQELRAFRGHTERVRAIAFSPDGKLLASVSEDKTLRVWQVSSGRELRTILHAGPIVSVAFSPDGRLLVSATAEGTVRVWGVR